MNPPDTSSRDAFGAMWARQQPFWHLAYAGLWSAALTLVLLWPPGRSGRTADISLLLGMGTSYVVFGRFALGGKRPRLAIAYQVLSWSMLLALLWLDPRAQIWAMLFALFPHLWAMLDRKRAAIGTVLGVIGFSAVSWLQSGRTPGDGRSILATALVSIAVSLALGLFIHSIVTEAKARAETIDELRAAQAQLAAVERDRGVFAERERLSREIHDTLAQGFTSVLALSRAAAAALNRGDAAATADRLALIEATAAENLAEARAIVAELTPGHLQARTLVEALERLTAAVRVQGGPHARLDVVGEPEPLGAATEVVLLRAAQEAVSNARRHAKADQIAVRLDYEDPDRVRLVVADDGVGFDPAEVSTGFGLDGLTARVQQLGGDLELVSAAGSGSTITVDVAR